MKTEVETPDEKDVGGLIMPKLNWPDYAEIAPPSLA